MEVGIIAPISMLDRYCTTKIQYFLPGLLNQSKRYKDFYQNLPRDTTKIMDCRKPTWKREPENLELCKQGLKLSPDYIVLPSYMFESERTIKVAKEYSRELSTPSGLAVACLEGTTDKEIVDCAKKLKAFLGYAIPSHLYNICKKPPKKPILIYLENHLKLDELRDRTGILVSSLPVRLGLQGRLLSNYLPSPPGLNFYEEKNEYPMVIGKNIRELIDYYGNEM